MNRFLQYTILFSVVMVTHAARQCVMKDACSCVWNDNKVEISLHNIDFKNDIRFVFALFEFSVNSSVITFVAFHWRKGLISEC